MIARINELKSDAEALVRAVELNQVELVTASTCIERIEKEIEALEVSLADETKSEWQARGSAYLVLQTRMIKLLSVLSRSIPLNLVIGNVKVQTILGPITVALESFTDGDDGLDHTIPTDLVTLAERPDFSPIHVPRKCRFENMHGEMPIRSSQLYSLLLAANTLSQRDGASVVTIEMSDDGNLACYEGGEQVLGFARRSFCDTRMAFMLVTMGLCNKIEQAFSPTSVICQIAKSCQGVARFILRLLQADAMNEGDFSWIDLVFPELVTTKNASQLLEYMVGIVKAERTESGDMALRGEFVIESDSRTTILKKDVIGSILLLFREVGQLPGIKLVTVDDSQISVRQEGLGPIQARIASSIIGVSQQGDALTVKLWFNFLESQ